MIVLYTTNCPRCRILESKLNEYEIKYDICSDVDTMIQKGFNSAPVLEVDGRTLNFDDGLKWIREQTKEI